MAEKMENFPYKQKTVTKEAELNAKRHAKQSCYNGRIQELKVYCREVIAMD